MSVEAMAPADNGAAVIESAQNAEAALDAEMAAVWDKHERDNGATRGEGGRFASPTASEDAGTEAADDGDGNEPLEGGEGEAAAEDETSTQSTDVPLPSNWQSSEMKEAWAKVPAELKPVIAAHDLKLRQTLSQQGQQISQLKPLGDVIAQYSEYFGGERGNHKPEQAVNYLFSLQRSMDDKPFETLMEIADRYGLVPVLQRAFGDPELAEKIVSAATPEAAGGSNKDIGALQAEISQLKRTITELNDPTRNAGQIKQVLEEDKLLSRTNDVITNSRKDMPLFDKIAEPDLVHFINRAWETLGETATQEAVLKRAYDQAVNADPDLRKQAAALKTAATADPKRVADARRATEANITSTSTGKHREPTDEEVLGAVFDKHKKG